MSPRLPLICLLLLAPTLVAQGPVTFHNRKLTKVNVERADVRGRWKFTATVELISREPVPINMGFRLRLSRLAASGLMPVGNEVEVPAVLNEVNGCLTSTPDNCGSGVCPAGLVDGQAVSGSCKLEIVDNPGGYDEYVCVCAYPKQKMVSDKVVGAPGTRFLLELLPQNGAAPDSPNAPDDDRLWIVIGSPADAPEISAPWRSPSPVGGQANQVGGMLEIQGLVRQGDGPYEYYGAPGTSVWVRHTACGPNVPVTLAAGIPQTATALTPGGSVDFSALLFPLYDGLGVFGGPATPFTSAASGRVVLPFVIPASLPPISLQGFSVDPTCAAGFRLTPRVDVRVQDIATLNAPALPPYSSGGPPPLPGGTSAFPFPRKGVVFPSFGTTSSGPSVRDGTLFSVVGVGFDATDPAATTVMMGGVPADVFVVRPHEILFFLRPAHRALIGGPIVVTSTGGTSQPVPDQMEAWVVAAPETTLIREARTFGPIAGSLHPSGGLQAMRGVVGPTQPIAIDRVAMGTSVKALVIPLEDGLSPGGLGFPDPADRRLHTGCQSGSPALCFSEALEPLTQMPTSFLAPVDLRLRHVHFGGGTAMPIAVQENGGPGNAAFAGMHGIPGAATHGGDPDGPFFMVGSSPTMPLSGMADRLVVDLTSLGANSGAYLLLTYW